MRAVLERNGNDPVVVDAALSGSAGSESALLETLLETKSESPQRAAAITMLAATVVRAGQDAPVQALFDRIARHDRPIWQRSALLRGAEERSPARRAGGGGRGRAATAQPENNTEPGRAAGRVGRRRSRVRRRAAAAAVGAAPACRR